MTRTFSEKLAELREKHGESQETLGKAVGVSKTQVGRWESAGEDKALRPNPEVLLAIAKHYGVSLDWLLDPNEVGEPQSMVSAKVSRNHIWKAVEELGPEESFRRLLSPAVRPISPVSGQEHDRNKGRA